MQTTIKNFRRILSAIESLSFSTDLSIETNRYLIQLSGHNGYVPKIELKEPRTTKLTEGEIIFRNDKYCLFLSPANDLQEGGFSFDTIVQKKEDVEELFNRVPIYIMPKTSYFKIQRLSLYEKAVYYFPEYREEWIKMENFVIRDSENHQRRMKIENYSPKGDRKISERLSLWVTENREIFSKHGDNPPVLLAENVQKFILNEEKGECLIISPARIIFHEGWRMSDLLEENSPFELSSGGELMDKFTGKVYRTFPGCWEGVE